MHKDKHPSGFNKNTLLLVVILTSVVNPFLGAAVNIALPGIGEEFDMNTITMSWVAMAFLLSSAVFLVPLGKAADILGRKKIFFYGNILVALSSLCCALSTSGTMLIIFRVVQGIGSAMTFATGMAIITSAFPPHERGKAIGINVSAVYLGLSIAPFLGGILTQTLGWRSLFLATLPFGPAGHHSFLNEDENRMGRGKAREIRLYRFTFIYDSHFCPDGWLFEIARKPTPSF